SGSQEVAVSAAVEKCAGTAAVRLLIRVVELAGAGVRAHLHSFPTRRSSDLPKSPACRALGVSSRVVTEPSVPAGASFTEVTLRVEGWRAGVKSRPWAVSDSCCGFTPNVADALASLAVAWVRRPRALGGGLAD